MMFASLSTWRLDESIQDDDAYHAFVRDVLRQTLPSVRSLGILDAVIVRTARDMIVALTLYDSQAAADAAWAEASGSMRGLYESKMEFVSRLSGPADDMPQLTENGNA